MDVNKLEEANRIQLDITNLKLTKEHLLKSDSVEFHTNCGHGMDDKVLSICLKTEFTELQTYLLKYYDSKISELEKRFEEL